MGSRLLRHVLVVVLGVLAAAAQASEWRPERAIEIIAGSGAGGAQDRTARTMQRIWKERGIVTVPVNVVNKPGGGGSVMTAALNQQAGDAHYIATGSPTLLINNISGRSKLHYNDVTSLALLFGEYIVLAVRDDSPIKSGSDLAQRMKADPGSVSAAVATARAGMQHIAVGLLAKAAGADVRKLKVVVFNSGGESITALLGGHVDVVATAAANAAAQVQGGRVRVLGIAAPQRLEGLYAGTPTFREQGYDVVSSNFRTVLGPRGMTAPQIAFWENALQRLVRTPEWQADMAKNHWVGNYLDSKAILPFYAAETETLRGVLGDLLAN